MAGRTTAEWYDDGLSLLNSGFFDSAIKCFDEVLEVEPTHAAAWALKATALTGLEQYQEAAALFDRAIEIDPLNAQAWKGKALCLTKLGREEEAARCQEEAKRATEGATVLPSLVNDAVPTLYSAAQGLVSNAVRGLAADENEAWFVYGKQGGATRLTLQDQRLRTYTQDDGLASDAVTCAALAEDHVWLGTHRGVSRFDKGHQEWTSYTPETGLKGELIYDLAVDGELLWLGTDSGLVVLDTITGRSALCKEGPHPTRVDCLLAHGRQIWCGSKQEGAPLWVFDKQAGRFRKLDVALWVQGLQSHGLDGEKKVWVASRDSIAIIDTATLEMDQVSLPGMLATGIAVGMQRILIGTTLGLAVMEIAEAETGRKVEVKRTDIGRGKYISAVCASRTREWIAIEGEGVCCLSYSS